MASRVKSAREDFYRFRNCRRNLRTWRSRERGGARTGGCLWKTERETSMGGMVVKRRLFVGIVLLLLQNTLAFSDDSSNYEASGSTVLSVDQATPATSPHQLAGLLMTDEDSASVIQSQPTSLSKDIREQPAFSSILSALASTAAKPQSPFHSFSVLESETNHSHSEGPIQRAKSSFRSPSSSAAEHVSNQSSSAAERVNNQSSASEEPPLDEWVSELVSSVVASRETGLHSKGNDSHVFASKRRITTLPSKTSNASIEIELAGHELVASSVPQLTTVTTTTVVTATTTTTAPSPVTTTTQLTSTTRLNSSRPSSTTSATSTATFKAVRIKVPALIPAWAVVTQAARATPPRGLAGAHPTTTTTTSTTSTTTRAPLSCNVTDRMWVKTVLSVHPRRYRLDSILKQNLLRGLTLVTGKALNIRDVQVQIESLSVAANVTVGYYVAHGDQVFTASVVAEALNAYSQDRLVADIRQFVPHVQAAPVPAAPWRPRPATSLMLKTVLRFVGPGDDVRFCAFTQMMEQSLQNAFTEAEVKALSSRSKLTVQMLTVTQSTGSPAVSLIYVVHNGSVALNGTEASTLLSRLTAELVGYFLFYPPLITAEPLEYHNLNTSAATKNFWVITVIQDVENTSLESQYQSFASLMEQRLAELFLVAHQQGSRFRRATAAGSYTVQMVGMRRLAGPKNPVELTYYVEHDGTPLPGTSAAKILNTVDSQTMALTLGYFVQVQAEPVVKNPSNNLWIIAAVLAPIGVVTIIIIIITAVLCRKNKSDFKTDPIGHLNPRVKTAYRRDVGYYHQPVQGFDYAKQHLGQQSGDEETLPVKQEPLVLSLPVRDTSLSLDKVIHPDGTNSKKTLTADVRKRLPSEEGSVISSESAKGISSRGSAAQKVTAQQKLAKEESGKRGVDPYDTSSGSLQLISIKPMVAPPTYSHPASSDRSQDSANLSGEVSLALKQKSDIEHYRNKLRLKAKRKGYYDFPSAEGGGSSKALSERGRHGQDRAARPPAAAPHAPGRAPDDYDDRSSTYVKSHRRHSQVTSPAYRSRQSLNSPSPGGTEMDLLVMRERPRKGIRNSGYDTEPELVEETDVDRLAARRHYGYGRQVKGHSETSTLSSQPSIDEVRQQMHLLLEEAFSLASAGHSSSGRRHQYHPYHQHQQLGAFSPGPPLPYSEVVTSAPGTMIRGRGGLQWMPAYGQDLYQCSLTKPTFRFTQLPEMEMGSPPPIPPRTGPPPGSSLRRSSSDLGPKVRSSESSVQDMQSQQHESNPYVPVSRAPPPPSTSDSAPDHSGNPMTAVYAIPAGRPGYTGYFISTPPSSYHSPSWMSYPPEPEDVPSQWADSVPLPGYAEAFPHPHYPQGSPLLWKHSQAITPQGHLEQPPSAATSQQSLAEPRDLISPDTPLSSLSTSALVKAIRDEVAKLAKKQADMFEFQV